MDEADFTSALSNDFMPLGFERMVSKYDSTTICLTDKNSIECLRHFDTSVLGVHADFYVFVEQISWSTAEVVIKRTYEFDTVELINPYTIEL